MPRRLDLRSACSVLATAAPGTPSSGPGIGAIRGATLWGDDGRDGAASPHNRAGRGPCARSMRRHDTFIHPAALLLPCSQAARCLIQPGRDHILWSVGTKYAALWAE